MKKNYNFLKNTKFVTLFMCASLLSVYNTTAQNLNFTIDGAIDNGTSITEIISIGADVYVLNVLHPGNEELDDLGGGDKIFYLSAIDPLEPYSLTITKNGLPFSFNLNSIDYDSVGQGTISVTNQNDEIISAPITYTAGVGSLLITDASKGLNVSEIKIIPTGVLDLNKFGFHNINVEILVGLGLKENALLYNSVSVYPNPSYGNITINTSIALEKAVVSDINGRTIATYNLNGFIGGQDLKMNSILSKGMYLMKISSAKHSITKKIIIR